jgi:hypothetical protein
VRLLRLPSDGLSEGALLRTPRLPGEATLEWFERVLLAEGITGIPEGTLPYREPGEDDE